MALIEKKICKKIDDYKKIEAFIKRVFPKEELLPMVLIRLMTLKKGNKFSAFYEEGKFIGILFTLESKESIFIFYLAVNDEIQSNGYGSKILDLLKKSTTKTIILFIESLDDKDAPNYDQRCRRLAFYERNGFYRSNIRAGVKSPELDILSTNKHITVDECKRLVRFTPLKIKKAVDL